MDLDELCRRLEEALQQPPQSIQPDTAFADIPNFDSAAQIEVILLLDERYGVQIPDDTLPRLERVRDLAPLVAAARGAAGGRQG
jgi:acyl carrier protein